MSKAPEFFRVAQLPPYPLGEIADAVRQARVAGRDVIDLSQVNPGHPPPAAAVDTLVQACLQPHNHRYSASRGVHRLREAGAGWYESRYGVSLNPESEIVATMGSKEAMTHLLLSVLSPGDTVLVPTPSYPIHTAGVSIAGASFVGIPLFDSFEGGERHGYELSGESDAFFSRLRLLYHRTWPRPRAMIVSFPHNPTSTTVDRSFWERLVGFAAEVGMLLIHDFAYADLCYDGYRAPSLLEIPQAREVGVECYSLSKGLSMAGWRVGFCSGGPRVVGALTKIKSYLDFGIFQPLQIGAVAALKAAAQNDYRLLEEAASLYRERRDVLVSGLARFGWEVPSPKAAVFVWARIPARFREEGSFAFARRILDEASVALCPGSGFDIEADEYVRIALMEEEHRIRIALRRLEPLLGGSEAVGQGGRR